ncbi:DUF1484 family protein [Chromobacterium haemolyticum]|uniref:DUF1484 family protein n=1 Tax=Chromobacterium haemolyticum TaxID=394935 RepID=A0ABS3GL94_9NEIS|nr:DUF1484 family protein [Chromobacterium haemolyticum]MBK0413914.1 DUF1484 family protein [Chromobacterium haemolyticum]MBO0415399.1 DUF1484 family protein [Chromobacterium haemolyticum]MBO0498660.1 DUF1484 family protein [Chromobacterium haemolyticum]OQS30897.1 DUF1484 domain-containing protein [Chromobacterium haemolyticum]QOD84080.1 DUF1484 family protein [Chromobacterium haemolyticum]
MDAPMPVMEQLKQLNQHLLDAQPDQTALSHLGQQLSQQCAEMDACLLQGLMELRAAHIGLQAILTLLQLHDEPVQVSSDEAVALLEPVQQRLSHGLSCINRLV